MTVGLDLMVLQIGIVLFISMVLGALFAKLKQSSIIGYVLGGILLGPAVLGFVNQTEIILLFSELGILLLMFYIGLELDLKKFKEGGFFAIILGPTKMIICFGFGFLVGVLFGFGFFESALIGLIISMSSTAIIGKYLIDNKLTKSMEASISIPMLLIEDFIAIIVLALLSAAGTKFSLTSVILNSIFFVIVSLFIISCYSKHFIRLMEKLAWQKHIALFAVGIALALAFLAKFFGLSPAIGAFLGGFLIAQIRHSEKIKIELDTFREFFSVFFFIAIGLSFTLPSTTQAMLFTLALGLSVLALYLLGEWIAYGVVGTLIGLKKEFAIYMANVMIPIGEFSLIIAGIAISLQLPHAVQIVNLSIFLGISSTLVTPTMIKNSDRITSALSRLVPGRLIRIKAQTEKTIAPVSNTYLSNSSSQELFNQTIQTIGMNLFAIFAVFYLVASAALNFDMPIIAGMNNQMLFGIIGLLLILPALVNIRKNIKKIVEKTVEEIAAKKEYREILKNKQQTKVFLRSIFFGLFFLAASGISWIISRFLKALYFEITIVFIVIAFAYIIKAVIIASSQLAKHDKLRKVLIGK